MDNTTQSSLAPYWLELYRKADEARSRKEAVALLREAQRLSDRERFGDAFHKQAL